MNKKLKKLEKEGIVNVDELSGKQQADLDALLTDDDVNRLIDLNDRTKSDSTLGALSAVTRSGG
jgi:hypothetical protein